jgi:hypothetical protein
VRSSSVVVVVIVGIVILDALTSGSTTDGQTSRKVVSTLLRTRNAHRSRGATERGTDRHIGWQGAMGGIETCLDEIFALWLGDEGLKLCSSKGVYEACL